VTLAQSATAAPSTPVVAAICVAEILGLARFLDRSGVVAAVHRGLVADQHASRIARRDRLGWLYARRYPSRRPHRSPARAADLSRLERAQRTVLLWHPAMRPPASGAPAHLSLRHTRCRQRWPQA